MHDANEKVNKIYYFFQDSKLLSSNNLNRDLFDYCNFEELISNLFIKNLPIISIAINENESKITKPIDFSIKIIFLLISKITVLMSKLCEKTKFNSLILDYFLFDNELNPIAIFQKELSSNDNNHAKFMNIINDYLQVVRKKLTSFRKKEKIISNNSFQYKISQFMDNLYNLFKINLHEDQSFPQLSEQLVIFSRAPDILSNIAFQKSDFNLLYLFFIGKYQIKLKSNLIFKILDKAYNDQKSNFNDILEKNNSQTYLSLLHKNTIEIIAKKKQEGDKSCFDLFTKIIEENLSKQSNEKQFTELNSDKCKQFFNSNVFQYKIFFDEQLKIYLLKQYSAEFKKELKQREQWIFENRFSNFLAPITKHKERTVENTYFSYYPNGTLGYLLNTNNILFTIEDKFTIIRQISIAIKDLHDNNEYHGHLTDQCIAIDSEKNAFIIGACYYITDPTVFNEAMIYLPSQNDNTKLNDIYSLGILIYEIITNKTPQKIYNEKKFTLKEIKDIIKNNIYDQLLSDDESSKYFQKEEMKGVEDIIRKCLKGEYQKMDDFFQDFNELSFCKNNNNIKTRSDIANTNSTKTCTLYDVFRSYFKCSKSSISIISEILHEIFNNDYKCAFFINLITDYYNIFDFQDPKDIENFNLISRFLITEDNQTLIKTYKKFLSLYGNIDSIYNLIDIFNEIQIQEEYGYYHIFFKSLIEKDFNQDLISHQFQKLLEEKKEEEEMHEIFNLDIFNDYNSSFKLLHDKQLFFYMQKTYLTNVDSKHRIKERNIFSDDYPSKFIIHIDEKINPNDENTKLYLPYFPNGTLYSSLKNNYEFSELDQITMILEIAYTLRELHNKRKFHVYLSDRYIYIDSSNNGYLGAFCHVHSEISNPKPHEVTINFGDNENPETETNDVDFEKGKRKDIYAFGILMYQILTHTTIESKLNGKTKKEKEEIRKGNKYINFLFNEEDNKFFDENIGYKKHQHDVSNLNDIFELCLTSKSKNAYPQMIEFIRENVKKEDNDKSMMEIIKKCLTENNRYDSIDDVIYDIENLHIYKKRQTDIETRLSLASDGGNCKCTLADLVKSLLQGNCHPIKILKRLETIYKIEHESRSDHNNNNNNNNDNNNDSIIFDEISEFLHAILNIDLSKSPDFSPDFNKVIDEVFQKQLLKLVDPKIALNNDDKLFMHSKEINERQLITEAEKQASRFIPPKSKIFIPYSNLRNFLNENEGKTDNMHPIFAYALAKELQLIHSNNSFVGNLSQEMIGVYYHSEYKMFVPSIILYNFLMKRMKVINTFNSKCEYKDDFILKQQRKDIKALKSIFKALNLINDVDVDVDDLSTILNNLSIQIKDCKINSLLCPLEINYKPYQLTFSSLREIILSEKMFSLKNTVLDFGVILQIIDKLLDKMIENPKVPVSRHLSQIVESDIRPIDKRNKILQLLSIINLKFLNKINQDKRKGDDDLFYDSSLQMACTKTNSQQYLIRQSNNKI